MQAQLDALEVTARASAEKIATLEREAVKIRAAKREAMDAAEESKRALATHKRDQARRLAELEMEHEQLE